MKKNYLFLATVAIMMASCANDDFGGDGSQSGPQAIAFNMSTPAMTRAELGSKGSAEALGKMFIVWGEKKDQDDLTAVVFKNYVVKYTENTKNTTISNTADWEYVGVDHSFMHNSTEGGTDYVTENIGKDVAQTIKYWDDKAKGYTFTAVSATEEDIKNGRVIIAKTTKQTDAYANGYTVTVKSGSTPGSIYYADRTEVNPGTDGKYTYQAVKLQFRNFQSKIRFGIYETVPGYKVVITGIKYHTDTEKTNSSKGFGVDGDFIVAGDNTKYTVTYEGESSPNKNKVKVSSDTNSTKQKYFETNGENWLRTHFTSSDDKTFIGESAPAATYDKSVTSDSTTDAKAYTAILPNPDNGTDMTLQVSYDLYADDTFEKIETGYHTVNVPAAYCQWKSNYAYTYLFKITDKSADLYPITFDACVVTDEIGNQETITEVSEPSITTFGVSEGKYVSGKDEYKGGDVIYATVVDGSSLATLTADNIKLYTVTATGTQTISEASVANCLVNGTKDPETSTTTWTATAGTDNVLTVKSQSIAADSDLLNVVPAEDGTDVTLDESAKKALKWTATENTTYAIEYIKGSDSDKKKYYKIVKVANE